MSLLCFVSVCMFLPRSPLVTFSSVGASRPGSVCFPPWWNLLDGIVVRIPCAWWILGGLGNPRKSEANNCSSVLHAEKTMFLSCHSFHTLKPSSHMTPTVAMIALLVLFNSRRPGRPRRECPSLELWRALARRTSAELMIACGQTTALDSYLRDPAQQERAQEPERVEEAPTHFSSAKSSRFLETSHGPPSPLPGRLLLSHIVAVPTCHQLLLYRLASLLLRQDLPSHYPRHGVFPGAAKRSALVRSA